MQRVLVTSLFLIPACFLCALGAQGQAGAPAIVLNEIFYNAPDDLNDLQFIELHNPGPADIALGGWKLTQGVRYEFAAAANLPAGGFLVLCKNAKPFKKHYGFDAAGHFTGSLSRNGERIELVDNAGKVVDAVIFGTRAPWPVSADGHGASLERICPLIRNTAAENWAASPLPTGRPSPCGTPGKKNANYASRLPPAIAEVKLTPLHPRPGQELQVEAAVRSDETAAVELRYRIAGSGFESAEQRVKMVRSPDGRYSARIPGQKANQLVRFRIHASSGGDAGRFFPQEHDLRPALSCYVHEKGTPGRIPFGYILNVGHAEQRAARQDVGPRYGAAPPPLPARGRSAFVYQRPNAAEAELFDFVQVTPRTGGRKVRFHKDQMLDGMSTINLIYEYSDRFVLAEPLAYEVYRLAGNVAPRTDFVRTWIDGQPIGYQLLVEQPNKAFLQHNGLNSDGHLYKLLWYGQGVVGQHEKKTRINDGHADLVKLIDQLNRTRGDAQWEFIKKHFEVEQVINYFAVNTLLSHWDGFFNNYFTYHDSDGTGKWTMYPWDQDKTWGMHDGISGYEVFTDMPITFGMSGGVPPGGGPVWWRQAGFFSGPLLANKHCRKLFLARTKELLEQVYTEEKVLPLIRGLGERLEEEVRVQAGLRGQDPREAVRHLHRNLDALRNHLTKRRQFLLAQDEIKKAGAFDRAELK